MAVSRTWDVPVVHTDHGEAMELDADVAGMPAVENVLPPAVIGTSSIN